jgi:CRP-like cAMP-binding protein
LATLSNAAVLKRVPLFSNLTDTQATSLIGSLDKKRYRKSETIVEIGAKNNALFVILSGRAEVVISNQKGKEVMLAVLEPGDCIGELSLLDDQPHSATVIAITAVDALVLGRHDFGQCILNNAALAVSIMHGLASRLRKANQKIASLALLGVNARVAQSLLDSAVPSDEGHLVVARKISHSALAKEVGASREMVSKAFKAFENQEFIQKLDNGHLKINERRRSRRD